jgi:hypothetical protein
MRFIPTLSATLLALASASAFAQAASAPGTATPGIDKREARQEQRIDQGVKSGQLNARETLRLEREQKRIAVAEQKAKADGTVTPQERKKIHLMQDKASRDIHREKHDAQTASGAATGKK